MKEQDDNLLDEIRSYLEFASTQFYWGLSANSTQEVQVHTKETVKYNLDPQLQLDDTHQVHVQTKETEKRDLGALKESLFKLNVEVEKCTRCPLYKTRNKVVFGDGNPLADLMFIGEAPGEDENAQGLPFVGRAGKLLTDIITAMGLKRTDVYIANAVKCWPPGNRTPDEEEIQMCNPFLMKQIELIKPRVIVALGAVSMRALFRIKSSIFNMRGRFIEFKGIKVMPTFHPGFLLRRPEYKKQTWEDIKLVMKELNLNPPNTRRQK